VQPR